MDIKEQVKEIIEKYYDRYYSSSREDESGKEIEMENELRNFFEKLEIQHHVEVVDGYESSGYECDTLFVAWVDFNDKLEVNSVLLENM